MEASFIGNKQVDPRNLPESNTRKIPDEELDKKEVQRLKAGAKEPGTNKLAGAASRDPKDYDTSKRGGQGNTQLQQVAQRLSNVKPFLSVSSDMLMFPELFSIIKTVTRQPISMRIRTLYRASGAGKRMRGETNMKRHYDPLSTAPSSATSEFDPKRELNFPVDPKSNPDNCTPFEGLSGDFNRSGMRSTEYSCVDKREEPYSSEGGEHRYGGTRQYEWSAERLKKESKENGGSG